MPNIVSPTPVSDALTRDLATQVREKGVVVWLDADRSYTDFVDHLKAAGTFAYPIAAFRGSHLELMFALEGHANDLDPDKVLIHMPGFNTTSITETPLLEIFRAGKRHEIKLTTLIAQAAHGHAMPGQIQAFTENPNLTLAAADTWLANQKAGLGQSHDELQIYLEGRGMDGIITDLQANAPDLGRKLAAAHNGAHRLRDHLCKTLGLTQGWAELRLHDQSNPGLAQLADLALTWLMAVEFVSDLREPPKMDVLKPLVDLPKPFVKLCRTLVAHVRETAPQSYRALASDVETIIEAERRSHHAQALGNIDTFRFEEDTIRGAALSDLEAGNWASAFRYADERTPENCFWVRHDPLRQRAWALIRQAGQVGRAITQNASPFAGCASLDEAARDYATHGSHVDREHRLFEQMAFSQLTTELVDYDRLLDVQLRVRQAYRDWADQAARAFTELCRQHGPLPSRDLRQREVYERHVHPRVQEGARTAYFMVDAMRFEMAIDLEHTFKDNKWKTNLVAALAELPSVTEVGMNALAPTAHDGLLRPLMRDGKFGGLRAGEFTVSTPKDRVAAMKTRSLQGDPIDLTLDELVRLPLDRVKAKLQRKSNLIVVRSRELDNAGESGAHLGAFSTILTQLRDAVTVLAEAGVEHFVLASDHGFLLQDTTTTGNEPLGARKTGKKPRYMLSDASIGASAETYEVPLSALEYQVDAEHYLAFRTDTAMWKTTDAVAPFVHGGNSPQERVIPVLTLRAGKLRGKTTTQYEVVATGLPARQGRQRLQIQVRLQRSSTATLNFHGPRRISLALRVPGRPNIGIHLITTTPPATLEGGMVYLPPGADAAMVEFDLDGAVDERVRVEVYHAEGLESVTPKVVDDFFDVARVRGRRVSEPPAPVQDQESDAPASVPVPAPEQDWRTAIEDESYRRVFEVLETRRSVNEIELQDILGSPRRVRIFARQYDELVRRVPFRVEITTQGGLKTYVKKNDRKD